MWTVLAVYTRCYTGLGQPVAGPGPVAKKRLLRNLNTSCLVRITCSNKLDLGSLRVTFSLRKELIDHMTSCCALF